MKSVVAGAFALLAAQSASAAVITVNGAFTATNWSVFVGTPAAPIDPLTMTYSVTFDTDLTYDADASVLNIIATNVPYPVAFSWSPIVNAFLIATDGNHTGCSITENKVCIVVRDLVAGIPIFIVQSPAGGGAWIANTVTAAVVPEPASWAMMIAGFGLAGMAMRRRRSAPGSALA